MPVVRCVYGAAMGYVLYTRVRHVVFDRVGEVKEIRGKTTSTTETGEPLPDIYEYDVLFDGDSDTTRAFDRHLVLAAEEDADTTVA